MDLLLCFWSNHPSKTDQATRVFMFNLKFVINIFNNFCVSTNAQSQKSLSWMITTRIPHSAKFWQGKYWRIGFIRKFDGEILMDSLLSNLYLLESIERENFDGSLAKYQICQYFPRQNFVLYSSFIQWYLDMTHWNRTNSYHPVRKLHLIL